MNGVDVGNRRRIVSRSLATWIVLITAEIVHGIIRAIVLVPFVGEFRSNQIGVFSGSAIILLIAYLTIRWIGAIRPRELWSVGLIWSVMTVLFEVSFGRLVMRVTWERIFADYNLLDGGLMPLGILFMILAPIIAFKLRRANELKPS